MPSTKKDSKSKKTVKQTPKVKKGVKKTSKPKKESKPKVKVVEEIVESIQETKDIKKTKVKKTKVDKNQSKEVPEIEKSISSDKFLKDFDWENFEEGIETVDEKKLVELEKLIEKNFVDTYNDSVVEGVIINLTDREAIIDINAKSEGVISLNEFRYNPDLKVGDKVEVLVDIQEDKTGQLILSHRKARTIKAWDRVNEAHDKSTVVTGFVKCRTKGGMIVDVFGLEAFLPGSQIDVKPIRDYDQYVNKNMEFKVVKINHEFKNVVVSHKALIEADIEEQ
ncbi:uncharacterized protein METZ01_LOCUS56298, partial [marine metagenome]